MIPAILKSNRKEIIMELKHNGLLEEIYDKAISDSGYMKQVEYEIARKLEPVLSGYRETLTEQKFAELEEIVNGSTVITEKVAFIAGIRYGMQLLVEGVSTGNNITPESGTESEKQE